MKDVRLKSKIGPYEFRIREMVGPLKTPHFTSRTVSFEFENDFKNTVSREYWERQKELPLDRSTGLKFKEAFEEL